MEIMQILQSSAAVILLSLLVGSSQILKRYLKRMLAN